MNDLRSVGEATTQWSDDYHAAVFAAEPTTFLLLIWYKYRGRTDDARIVHADAPDEALTLETAEMILQKAAS